MKIFVLFLILSYWTVTDAFQRMTTSWPRIHSLQLSSNNNENNQLGGDLVTKGLFGLTELFGKISNPFMSSSTTSVVNDDIATTTKPSSVPKNFLSVANSIKKEYENIFWATGNGYFGNTTEPSHIYYFLFSTLD